MPVTYIMHVINLSLMKRLPFPSLRLCSFFTTIRPSSKEDMHTANGIRTFQIHNDKFPSGPASAEQPLTSPLTCAIGRAGPLTLQLIFPEENEFDAYTGRLYSDLNKIVAHELPPPRSLEGHRAYWIKVSSSL